MVYAVGIDGAPGDMVPDLPHTVRGVAHRRQPLLAIARSALDPRARILLRRPERERAALNVQNAS